MNGLRKNTSLSSLLLGWWGLDAWSKSLHLLLTAPTFAGPGSPAVFKPGSDAACQDAVFGAGTQSLWHLEGQPLDIRGGGDADGLPSLRCQHDRTVVKPSVMQALRYLKLSAISTWALWFWWDGNSFPASFHCQLVWAFFSISFHMSYYCLDGLIQYLVERHS